MRTRKERKRERARAIGRLKRSRRLSDKAAATHTTPTLDHSLVSALKSHMEAMYKQSMETTRFFNQMLALKDAQIRALQASNQDLSARVAQQATMEATASLRPPQQVYCNGVSMGTSSTTSGGTLDHRPLARGNVQFSPSTLHSTSQCGTSSIPPSQHFNQFDNGYPPNTSPSDISNGHILYRPIAHQTMPPSTPTLHSTLNYDQSSISPSQHYNGNDNGCPLNTSPSNISNGNILYRPIAHENIRTPSSTPYFVS